MSKQSRSEGNRVAQLIKASKTEYYVADVDLEDSGPDVIAAVDLAKKTLGKVQAAFVTISAGVENLIVVVSVPESKKDTISAKTWLLESLTGISTTVSDDSTDTLANSVIKIDTPFKLKDTVRSNAFAYLRKMKLLEEESEEEECYEFE